MFHAAQLDIPSPNLTHLISSEVAELVGGVQNIHAVSHYFFKTVHLWMPILSKIGFSQLLARRMAQEKAELYVLVLAMKLLSSRVTVGRSRTYQVVRQLHTEIVLSGVMSLQVLQAGILIALYEMGHALYPNAYISIAQCARYGTALGVDATIQTRRTTSAWSDLEEPRRAWWAVLVLDRYATFILA